MADIECPWCETKLSLPEELQAEEQSCTECLTRWRYEATPETELLLAA